VLEDCPGGVKSGFLAAEEEAAVVGGASADPAAF